MQPEIYRLTYRLKDNHWWFINHRSLICRLIRRFSRPATGRKILDAGCGPNVMLRQLKEYGWTIGLDYSAQALEYCLRDNAGPLCRASITCLPFKEDTFDLAVIGDVLYHRNVFDDGSAIREIYRCLKPKGVAVFCEPAFEMLRRKHDIAEHTARRYTAGPFKSKIQDAGFKVKDVFYADNLIFIAGLFTKAVERLFGSGSKAKSDLIALPATLNKMFAFLAVLETRLSTRIRLPFGLTVVCVASKP